MKIEVQTDRKNKSKKRFRGGGKLTGGKIVHSYLGVELLHFIQMIYILNNLSWFGERYNVRDRNRD